MNAELIGRLQRFSDGYASQLWTRFLNNEAVDEAEQAYFQKLREWGDPEKASPKDLGAILSGPGSSVLSDFLFRPGSNDGVFINLHASFLNHWIHSHAFFEIIYVAKGTAVDWIDGVEVELHTHELCIHNPNARHQILKMNEGEDLIVNILLPVHLFRRSFYSLLMENRELDQFFNNYILSDDTDLNYMAFRDTGSRVDTIMELLIEEFLRGDNASRFVLESTLVVLFGELMRGYRSDDFLRELVAYITDHMTEISMQSAAAHFGYHKNYFPRIIRQHSSRSFWELVTEIRIQRAANLLLFTDSSIESISAGVGYKSTASFYEHFQRRYRMTPKEYRNRS